MFSPRYSVLVLHENEEVTLPGASFVMYHMHGIKVIYDEQIFHKCSLGEGVVLVHKRNTISAESIQSLSQSQPLSNPIPVIKEFQRKTDGRHHLLYVDKNVILLANDITGTGSLFFNTDASPQLVTDSIARARTALNSNRVLQPQVGAAWRGPNVMSGSTLLQGISSPGPGSMQLFSLTDKTLLSDEQYATLNIPPAGSTTPDEVTQSIKEVLHRNTDGQIVLALSGGLDSRFMLSLMLDMKIDFTTVSYGNNADSILAKKLAKVAGIPHEILQEHFSIPEDIPMIETFIRETNGVIPFASAIKNRDVAAFARNKIIYDGGFAEIGRMQFAKKLLLKPASRLKEWKEKTVRDALRNQRFGGFSEAFSGWLEAGYREDLTWLGTQLKPYKQLSKPQFVQMASIKSRLPWFAGTNQRVVDMELRSIMPIADGKVLEKVVGLPFLQTFGGHYYRRSILDINPELTKLPLVKGTSLYKFPLNAFRYYKPQIVGEEKYESLEVKVLRAMESYVRSRHTVAVISKKELYDTAYLNKLVEEFYHGRESRAAELEAWLTFDIWSDGLDFDFPAGSLHTTQIMCKERMQQIESMQANLR